MTPPISQEKVVQFAQSHNLLHDPAIHALDLVSEVGEVTKEILLATHYGQRSPKFRAELAGEIGDALYSLLLLAESCSVKADDALEATLGKYIARLEIHASPGNPNTKA
jgi:NTP pyrophosphatase (non-canonical NTP hydrolase)